MLDDLTTDADDKTVHSASPTASSGWRSWRPNTAPSGGGCGSSNIAGGASAAAFTTSRSRPAACASSRGWCRPSTGRRFERELLSHRVVRSSTRCSAAASSAARACWSSGPAGTGKSLLALTFVQTAIARGETAAMFVFDEELGLLFQRALGARHRSPGDGRRRAAGPRAGRRGRADAGRVLRAGARTASRSTARAPS